MDSKEPKKNKNIPLYFLIFCLFLFLLVQFAMLFFKDSKTISISYSDFLVYLEQNKVESVKIINKTSIEGILKNEKEHASFKTLIPYSDPDLINRLIKKGIKVEGQGEKFNFLLLVLNNLPFIFLALFLYYIFVNFKNSSSKTLSFGKTKIRKYSSLENKVTFSDVAGQQEAKDDLQEIIEFLKTPEKFKSIGAKVPKGVLLVGEPGTGKTLMARAIAGESEVSFFHMSGSDFVEMFVGVGASRVRDLFEQGKKNLPCIIFIDEIDAVGKARGSGAGNGGNDEREQTLNQLLVEMDGFSSSEGLIIVAATNRKDVLDPALLRPGRFDRQVYIALPDVKERQAILKIYTDKLKLKEEGEDKVDIEKIAKITTNFSGADLSNLANEAALLAARENKTSISLHNFEEAHDKIVMGNKRKSNFLTMSDKIKLETSYHECGHALVSYLIDDNNQINKVTIIPRGGALGATSYIANEDSQYALTNEHLIKMIKVLYGGYAAEKLVFENTSSGVANDLERATKIARKMVCDFGMSPLGPINFSKDSSYYTDRKNYSEKTSKKIDVEVKKILSQCLKDTLALLKENREKLDIFAQELVKKETMSLEEIKELLFKDENYSITN